VTSALDNGLGIIKLPFGSATSLGLNSCLGSISYDCGGGIFVCLDICRNESLLQTPHESMQSF